MVKQNETKKTDKKTLKDLNEFLKVKFKPKPMEIKPNKMTDDEMKDFYKLKITPVFEKIKKQLSAFKFETIYFTIHVKTATFEAFEELSRLYFRIDIDNPGRQIIISYEIKYRRTRYDNLIKIKNNEVVNISFRNIDTINEEMLISLFTKWYIKKDEAIQQHREAIENKSAKSKNQENNGVENENNEVRQE